MREVENPRSLGFRTRRRAARLLNRLRRFSRFDDKTWFVVLVVGIGLLAAGVSRGAWAVANAVQRLVLGAGGDYLPLVRGMSPGWWLILIPAAGGLAFGLIVHFSARGRGGEGLPEIMEAVSLKGSGSLRLRPVLWKSLASLILNATGGSVGREGPVAQTSAAIASSLARALKVPGHRLRVLVGCGVAAGMAATYSAPVGAAFFAMEVIFGNFALDVFGPIVLASAVAALAARPGGLSEPLFRMAEASTWSGWEIVTFILVGAVSALGIKVMTRTLGFTEKIFARLHLPPWLRVAVGGALVGLLAVRIPEVWGNGRGVVTEILGGSLTVQLLLLLFLAKVLATAFSLGSGGAGGIFTPALLVGASLGFAFGIGVAFLAPGPVGGTSAYAVAGMAGALAALTHAPVTGLLMVFDMTRDYGLLVPLMLASLAGAVVGRRMEKRSFYADRVRRRGVDLEMAFEDLALGTLRASDLMRTGVPTVHGDESIPQLLKLFGKHHENQAIVVDSKHLPVGVIDLRDVVEFSGDLSAGQIVLAWDLASFVEPVSVVSPLSEAMERIWRLDSALLPVVDPARQGRLVGAIARKDLLNAFDREMLRKRLVLTRFLVHRGEAESDIEGGPGDDYTMIEREVPERFFGKSLAELDLPAGRQVLVVALRRGEGKNIKEIMPPPADVALKKGDRLVLLGHRDTIEFFAV